MRSDTIKIDSIPLPERPVSVEIPIEFLEEFREDARIVIRHPWVVGLPVPELLLKKLIENPESYRKLTEKFEVMLIPR